jgi:hypothetical protein
MKVTLRRTETLYGATQHKFACYAPMEGISSRLMVTQWLKMLWASQTYSSKPFPFTTTLHAVLSQVHTLPQRNLDLPHGLIAIEVNEALRQRDRINGSNQS